MTERCSHANVGRQWSTGTSSYLLGQPGGIVPWAVPGAVVGEALGAARSAGPPRPVGCMRRLGRERMSS
jgi:hypothetical protein